MNIWVNSLKVNGFDVSSLVDVQDTLAEQAIVNDLVTAQYILKEDFSDSPADLMRAKAFKDYLEYCREQRIYGTIDDALDNKLNSSDDAEQGILDEDEQSDAEQYQGTQEDVANHTLELLQSYKPDVEGIDNTSEDDEDNVDWDEDSSEGVEDNMDWGTDSSDEEVDDEDNVDWGEDSSDEDEVNAEDNVDWGEGSSEDVEDNVDWGDDSSNEDVVDDVEDNVDWDDDISDEDEVDDEDNVDWGDDNSDGDEDDEDNVDWDESSSEDVEDNVDWDDDSSDGDEDDEDATFDSTPVSSSPWGETPSQTPKNTSFGGVGGGLGTRSTPEFSTQKTSIKTPVEHIADKWSNAYDFVSQTLHKQKG